MSLEGQGAVTNPVVLVSGPPSAHLGVLGVLTHEIVTPHDAAATPPKYVGWPQTPAVSATKNAWGPYDQPVAAQVPALTHETEVTILPPRILDLPQTPSLLFITKPV